MSGSTHFLFSKTVYMLKSHLKIPKKPTGHSKLKILVSPLALVISMVHL